MLVCANLGLIVIITIIVVIIIAVVVVIIIIVIVVIIVVAAAAIDKCLYEVSKTACLIRSRNDLIDIGVEVLGETNALNSSSKLIYINRVNPLIESVGICSVNCIRRNGNVLCAYSLSREGEACKLGLIAKNCKCNRCICIAW